MPPQEKTTDLGRVFTLQRSVLRPFADQPRKKFDTDELAQLARSIKRIGQREPIRVRRLTEKERRDCENRYEWEIVDGERRYRACGMIGKEEMKAIESALEEGDVSQFVSAVVANMCRADHSPMEIAFALERMTKSKEEGGEGMSVEDAAEAMGRSKPWAYQHLNLLRLSPALQERMHADTSPSKRISFQLGLMLSRLPKQVQHTVAKETTGRGLSHSRMLELAGRTANRMGYAPTTGRPRKERNDYIAIRQAVEACVKMLEPITDLRDSDIAAAFATRPSDQHRRIADLFSDLARLTVALQKAITRAKPK